MLLSILICTIEKRKEMFLSLIKNFAEQSLLLSDDKKNSFEVCVCDAEDISIGEKRNELIALAKGKFVVFVDDDDLVSDDYVSNILTCIEQNPDIDCIGIQGKITFDGANEKQWFISIDYKVWHEYNGIYYRTPSHISPIRRDIAQMVKFKEINHGEDSDFSECIFPLLKKEAKINSDMYFYRYKSIK